MSQHFPALADPRRFADLGKHFKGRIPLSSFSRLHALLVDPAGDAEFELKFGREAGRAVVRGRVQAKLGLECQRCRELMTFAADSELCLAVVEGLEEMELLPEQYDPLLLPAPTVKLAELLEDELLLSLPQVPMHPAGECVPPSSGDGSDAVAEKNPFAVLAELKRI